jgi:hypothetical protein
LAVAPQSLPVSPDWPTSAVLAMFVVAVGEVLVEELMTGLSGKEGRHCSMGRRCKSEGAHTIEKCEPIQHQGL